jgi:hypothetical protein
VQQTFAVGTNAATPWFLNYINSDDTLHVWFHDGTNSYFSYGLNKLRDVSAWYHIMYVVDTTQSTASDRLKVYINESEMTWNTYAPPAQNFDTQVNTTNTHYIGRAGNGQYFDGYIAETYFIDGQALSPTDFGEFDEDSGIWKPIEYTGTYGTNGFYLDFENSGSLGADQSGNGNNFTPTNLASTDQTTDTPTNNFATLNALTPVVTHTLSEGNLKSTNSSGTHGGATATINYPTSGKWYHEVRINAEDSSKGQGVGIGNQIYKNVTDWGNYTNLIAYLSDGTKHIDTGYFSYGVAHNAGDIIGVAYNADDQELTFYHDNSSQGTIPTSEMDGNLDFDNLCPVVFGRNIGQTFNFGQDSSFAGAETRQNNSDQNGYGDFYYAPPSGYLALCTQNLATELSPTIDDGSQYFNTVLYTGTGSDLSITGVGFQPDWVWGKCRSAAQHHRLFDSSRGVLKNLITSTTNAEATTANSLTSFDSDGFTLGTDDNLNTNTRTFVAWNWKANAGSTSSNTDGTKTTTVQASTTSGFSIVTYDGLTDGQTIGHGLGGTPEMIIFKRRDAVGSWHTWHQGLGDGNNYVYLNTAGAKNNDSYEYISNIGSSTVQLQGSSSFKNDTVGYFFRGIEGYSKFGSYTGNNSNDGPFVYLGFRPAFVIIKESSGGNAWVMYDNKREPVNPIDLTLQPYLSSAEIDDPDQLDFVSNGFKMRANQTNARMNNASGGTYIYMAFAENPFVSSTGIPVTAR